MKKILKSLVAIILVAIITVGLLPIEGLAFGLTDLLKYYVKSYENKKTTQPVVEKQIEEVVPETKEEVKEESTEVIEEKSEEKSLETAEESKEEVAEVIEEKSEEKSEELVAEIEEEAKEEGEEALEEEETPLKALISPLTCVTPKSLIPISTGVEGRNYTCSYPYSDEYFKGNQNEFNFELAKASLGLAVSVFNYESNAKNYLEPAAFNNIRTYNYVNKTDRKKCAFVIGQRKVGEQTVIAVGVRGAGYPSVEWGGDFLIGSGNEHEGFRGAANDLKANLEKYIKDIKGEKVLWITGYSRGAAIANMVAADYTSTSKKATFKKVFAYDFATPTVTKRTLTHNPSSYKNIFNIVNKNDVVPMVPFESWGFMRNGVDKYLPAMETDPIYACIKEANNDFLSDLGIGYTSRSNPDWNFHLHMVAEGLAVLFPTNASYSKNFQDALVKVIEKQSSENILGAIFDALVTVRNKSWVQKKELLSLLNYIAFVLSENHTQDVAEGLWDSTANMRDTYFHEHQPIVYTSWLLMGTNANIVENYNQQTREFGIKGDVDVTLYSSNGTPLVTVNKNGTVDCKSKSVVVGRRKGTQTLFIMPKSLDAYVVIKSNKAQKIEYLDITTEHNKTFNTSNKSMQSVVKKNGTYTIPLTAYQSAGKISGISGTKMGLLDTIYFTNIYTPSLVMEFEYDGKCLLYDSFNAIKDVSSRYLFN